MKLTSIGIICTLIYAPLVCCLQNGWDQAPSMGYNTRHDVGCSIDYNSVYLAKLSCVFESMGLTGAGYTLFMLDDCWQGTRNQQQQIVPDATRFPQGLQSVVQTLEQQGLTVGIMTGRDNVTCNGLPGSLGFEQQDAQTFMSWGMQAVLDVGCEALSFSQSYSAFSTMSLALGGNIAFSLDGGMVQFANGPGAKIANSWTVGPTFNNQSSSAWNSFLTTLDVLTSYVLEAGVDVGSGSWTDIGLLQSVDSTGRVLLNDNQALAQFLFACIASAPLFISGDVTLMSSDLLTQAYLNTEAIAVNQDSVTLPPVFLQGQPLQTGGYHVWGKPLGNGGFALYILNANSQSVDIACGAECFTTLLDSNNQTWIDGYQLKFRCGIMHNDLFLLSSPELNMTIEGGGVRFFLLSWIRASGASSSSLTPGDPHSAITLEPSIQPRYNSTIPGYQNYVEQCGEFVYRYFHTLGLSYPTMGQPYYFLETGLDEKGIPHPAFLRFFNNHTTPPRAGDILVAKGPSSGEFHTALISSVQGAFLTIFQANVPWDWQGSKDLYATLPVQYSLDTGKYYMPPLPTSKLGYNHDFPVAGWIHPTGQGNAIPGAPQ